MSSTRLQTFPCGLPPPVTATGGSLPNLNAAGPGSRPASQKQQQDKQQDKQVEDHPSGYPRLAALISTHPSFHVFRNFTALRVRELLWRQDRLVCLEEELDRLETGEASGLFRASLRADRNEERARLQEAIAAQLSSYDTLLDRSERALGRQAAHGRDVSNVRDWVRSTGQIARREAAYLSRTDDLVALGRADPDPTSALFEAPIVSGLIWLSRALGASAARRALPARLPVSRDPDLYIYSPALLRALSRFLVSMALLLLLFVPVLAALFVTDTHLRLAIVALASGFYIAILSIVAGARTTELFVAGATYSALLVVFVTGSSTA